MGYTKNDSCDLDSALNELHIFVGSALVRHAAEQAAIVASSDLPVLILGNTGTGKGLFARLIHRLSYRTKAAMVPVNCGAIPKDLVESTLFGHTKGAFTGAIKDQNGKFTLAHGGTLFLDEIGELNLEAQSKLLRAVEEGDIEPVGSGIPRKVDVRIISATNKDLRQEVSQGRFREDLYFRLAGIELELPALNARPGEVRILAAALIDQFSRKHRRRAELSPGALQKLEEYTWPGNIRELGSVLERSVVMAKTPILGAADIQIPTMKSRYLVKTFPPGFSLERHIASVRKQFVLEAMEQTGGNQSAAADLLGVSKQAVNQFLKTQGQVGLTASQSSLSYGSAADV